MREVGVDVARMHLAALGVAAVSLGLYLSDRAAILYRDAVTVNQAWASRQLRYLALGPLAAAVNAPTPTRGCSRACRSGVRKP